MVINRNFEDRLSRLEQVLGMILQQTASTGHRTDTWRGKRHIERRSEITARALVDHQSAMGENKGGSLNDRLAGLKQDYLQGSVA
ncbi:hypothetical protein ACLOJK_019226 [Asimina triloba]